MKDLSVSQSYLVCSLNDNGKIPSLATERFVCLLVGGLIDLIFAKNVIIGEDKKLCIVGEQNEENQHLNSLYSFIKESKPMTVKKLASEYAFTFTDKRIKLLIKDVGESLADLGYVTVEHGGIFGKTPCFIPDKKIVDNIIQNIRAELLEDGIISDNIIALVSLLEKSNQIKKYFSKYEKDQLKKRLQEMKESGSYKLVKEMADYVDTLVAVIAATGAAH